MADITKILLRRDSETNWQSVNPVLGLGEPGVAIDQNGNIIGFKIGDGNATWNDLTYQTGDFSAMAQRVEQLEDSTSDLANQVTNLSSTVDTLDSLVTDSENGIEALANKVSAQEVTIADNTRDISNLETDKENISNKVSQLSSESTNIQYPGAKAVYDAIEEVQDNIRAEVNARNAQDTLLSDRINSIETLIPDTAASDNKLTDQNFVNSSISTNTATFRGTFNIVTDLDLTTSASEQDIIEALNAKFESLQITPDNNDYCFVAYPNTENPDSFDKYDRYKYSENIWEYEFTLNNSSFTAAQWAAINSGISSNLVDQINTNTDDINNLQNTKLEIVTASDVNSESAANGQVLTADGNGGASWQNASSAGGNVNITKGATSYVSRYISSNNYFTDIVIPKDASQYIHLITIRMDNLTLGSTNALIIITNDLSTAFATTNDLSAWLYNNGYSSSANSYSNVHITPNFEISNTNKFKIDESATLYANTLSNGILNVKQTEYNITQ